MAKPIIMISFSRMSGRKLKYKENIMSKQSSSNFTTYSYNDLCDFIEGATFFATGGGGPKDVAHDLLMDSGILSVDVIKSLDVSDDMQLAFVAEVFAPSSIEVNKDFKAAVLSFENLVNPPAGTETGVLPGEVGAINSIIPAIVAGLSGAFLIADTQTDRALPTLDMGLFQLNVPFLRLDMLNDKGEIVAQNEYPATDLDSMLLEDDVEAGMEGHPELNGVGGFASYPMSGSDLKRYYNNQSRLLLPNTFDYARHVGELMKEPGHVNQIFLAIQDWLNLLYGPDQYKPYNIFTGYLIGAKQVHAEQDHGRADFISSDPLRSLGARVYYSNENMIAYYTLCILVRGEPQIIELGPMAMGPDSVCYLLTDTKFGCGYSFTNEAFTDDYGHPNFFRTHEIELVGIPEPALRRYGDKNIIENFKREITKAKAAFGGTFDGDYIPIEQLQGSQVGIDIPRKKGALGGDSNIILTSPVVGAKIGYTLDGSEPDHNSSVYDEPIPLSKVAGKQFKVNFFHENGPGMTVSAQFPEME